jgi:hypothetical protein
LIDIRKIPVYYIAMPGDGEERLRRLLQEYGFGTIIHVPGVFDKNKKIAVAKAHKAALDKALSEASGPFLILEEDVDISNARLEFSEPPGADAIYLGISTWGLKDGRGQNGMIAGERANNGFYRMFNMLTAHAVLHINHEYASFIARHISIFLEMGTNQDKLRAETMKYWNIYAQADPIFYQRGIYEKYTKFKIASYMVKPLSLFYL